MLFVQAPPQIWIKNRTALNRNHMWPTWFETSVFSITEDIFLTRPLAWLSSARSFFNAYSLIFSECHQQRWNWWHTWTPLLYSEDIARYKPGALPESLEIRHNSSASSSFWLFRSKCGKLYCRSASRQKKNKKGIWIREGDDDAGYTGNKIIIVCMKLLMTKVIVFSSVDLGYLDRH